MRLRAASGLQMEPQKPWEDEPQDLERFIDELQARFRLSTSENLAKIQSFQAFPGGSPERMFARFNLLAKPLEDERPRVTTLDQLKTSYLFHLRTIITDPEEVELTRDIKAAERERDIHGYEPLTRYEIHTLALRQDREDVIEQTKLRAVGLTRVSVKERLGDQSKYKQKGQCQDITLDDDTGKY